MEFRHVVEGIHWDFRTGTCALDTDRYGKTRQQMPETGGGDSLLVVRIWSVAVCRGFVTAEPYVYEYSLVLIVPAAFVRVAWRGEGWRLKSGLHVNVEDS